MRTRTLFSLTLLLLASGCASPADTPETPTDDPRTAAPAAPPRVALVVFNETRDLSLTANPADGAFDVPANATGFQVHLVYHRTAGPCWYANGNPPPRSGEFFPNPWVDFIGPDGVIFSVEASVQSGCDATGGNPDYIVEQQGDAVPGAWTVRFDVRGQNVELQTTVTTSVPAGA